MLNSACDIFHTKEIVHTKTYAKWHFFFCQMINFNIKMSYSTPLKILRSMKKMRAVKDII